MPCPVCRRGLRHDSGIVRSAGIPHPKAGDATRFRGQGVWRGAGVETAGSHHAAASAIRQNPGVLRAGRLFRRGRAQIEDAVVSPDMPDLSVLTMRIARFGLWLVLLPVLLACSQPPLVQQQSYVFGTLVEVSVYGAPEAQAKQAISAVLGRFDQLHRQLHAWQPSELSRLNAALAQGKRVAVTPELATMLR